MNFLITPCRGLSIKLDAIACCNFHTDPNEQNHNNNLVLGRCLPQGNHQRNIHMSCNKLKSISFEPRVNEEQMGQNF